ncbi:MAG: GNAT family N-acetyltransferase [Treponematales bacterium]
MFGFVQLFQQLLTQLLASSGFIAACVALCSFMYTAKRQRETEEYKIYQELELASVEYFRWEAENREALSKMNLEAYPDVSDEECTLIETWVTQGLNLFELCVSNHRRGIFPDKVFGTWLPWIHEFAHEPGFAKIWPEMKYNYLPELRHLIEHAMEHDAYVFISEICKKHKGLEVSDWIAVVPPEKRPSLIAAPSVTIGKGKLRNINKYVSLFAGSRHDGYISHGEVLCGRATRDFKWASDILAQMKREFFHDILSRDYIVFEILLAGELIGFAIVELYKKQKAAVLDDIMIKRGCQGGGIGRQALHQIEAYLKRQNIEILLLESGIKNRGAHTFFEKNGFTQVSVEYAKYIG